MLGPSRPRDNPAVTDSQLPANLAASTRGQTAGGTGNLPARDSSIWGMPLPGMRGTARVRRPRIQATTTRTANQSGTIHQCSRASPNQTGSCVNTASWARRKPPTTSPALKPTATPSSAWAATWTEVRAP